MKRLVMFAALASTLALGACGTISGGVSVTPTPAPIITTGNSTIDAVISSVTQACAFKPAEQTVAAILATFAPGVAPVNDIINTVTDGICAAITNKSARFGAGPPKYRGVRISGKRLR